jgi:hypothetical protein
MCLVLAVDNGMEDAYFGMFSTFIVQELGWTKKNGSYATSLYWGSFALGRLSAIIYGPRFKASKLFRYYISLFLAAMIGLFLSTVFDETRPETDIKSASVHKKTDGKKIDTANPITGKNIQIPTWKTNTVDRKSPIIAARNKLM